MKRIFQFPVFLLIVLLLPQMAETQYVIADHTKADLTLIPDGALSSAANLRVMLRRASVGGYISGGLDALQGANAKYNRSRWDFQDRGNPGWQPKVDDFVTQTAMQSPSFDVLSMKFCWIDPDAIFAYYRDALLQLESTYPSKRFVWWTMPIYRDPDGGESNRQDFNDSVRNFAAANEKLLFDIADIEAYNAAGQKKTDGSGHELQQGDWSLSLDDGGHLNDAGSRRVASAWWWLMARVAGWNGTTGVEEKAKDIPRTFMLSQNYPNPFNPTTTIEFSLAEKSKVHLNIYDILGHEMVTLVDEELQAGILYRVSFNASNLASGVYFYKLKTENMMQMKKLILMK